jgi:hypothetical protein
MKPLYNPASLYISRVRALARLQHMKISDPVVNDRPDDKFAQRQKMRVSKIQPDDDPQQLSVCHGESRLCSARQHEIGVTEGECYIWRRLAFFCSLHPVEHP